MAVSAVVPTYNRAEVIDRAITSLLQQSKPVDEIIVVDDASTDRTRQVVERLEGEKVKYYRHAENSGAAAARNTGIKHASGEYVVFLDSDDVFHRTAIEKMIAVLNRTGSNCVGSFTHYRRIDENGTLTQIWNEKSGIVTREDLAKFFAIPGISGAIIEASALERVDGFDERLALSEDADLAHRLTAEANLFVIDEVLLTSYDAENQLTSYDGGQNDELYLESEQLFLEKHGDDLTTEHYIMRCVDAAFAAFRTGNGDEGNRLLAKAVAAARDDVERAFTMQYIGRHCAHHGNTDTATRYFRRSLDTDGTQYPVYLYFLLSAAGTPTWMTAKKVKRGVQVGRYRLKRSVVN